MIDSGVYRLTLPADWTTVDEASLVRAAKSDREALNELCERYSGRLYNYLRARTHSDDDARDLLQQVLIKVIVGLPRYRERGIPFGAWAFRIARNTVADAHRRKRTTVSWESLAETRSSLHEDEVETIALRRDTELRVRRALDALPSEQRDLILLRFIAGLTLREIGAIVGLRESGVHKKLRRALQTIQEHYHAEE